MSGPPSKPDDEARLAILAPAAASLVPGAEIEALSFGHYEVVASIGKGGMGEVYLARVRNATSERGGAKLIALKVLLEEAGNDDELLAMFMDEASIMAQIHHPNVLEVYDFGKQRGLYFLAMEYLQGRPLVRVMIDGYQREQGLDYGMIALIGADAARGLHAAHVATGRNGQPLNVVHRDVSPQNIFVTYSGTSKVIDFGVARAAERISRTAVGQLKGKAAYMSPEQVNGGLVDGRSDVFALGACLWEMAAGRRLFRRANDWETMSAVLEGPIVSPSRVRGKVDPYLDAIILSALARNADHRTETAGELEAELTEYAKRLGATKEGVLTPFMQRLFGAEAESELALIRKLEAGVATDAEQDNLRRLSGISPIRDSARLERGITLAGRPEELSALDGYGPNEPLDSLDLGGQTDPTVAMPPDVLIAMRRRLMSAGGDTDPNATPPPVNLSRVMRDEQSSDPPLLTPPPTRLPTPTPVPLLTSSPEERAQAVHRAVEALQAQHHKDRQRSGGSAPAKRARGSTAREAKGWAYGAVGAAVLVMLAVIVRTGSSIDPSPDGNGRVGASGASGAPGIRAATVSAISAGGPTAIPSVRLATPTIVRFDTVVVDPGEDAAQLLAILNANKLAVVQNGQRLLVDDGSGAVTISAEASLLEVKAEGARGWVAVSRAPVMPQVTWIGALGNGPWRVRALSINDCPAQASLQPQGIEIAYGEHRMVLTQGGGLLEDQVLEPPGFANRLEIEKLGIAFGASEPGRSLVQCPEGWSDGRVLIRHVPPGRYALLWMGGGRSEQAVLTVPHGPTLDAKQKLLLRSKVKPPRPH